LTGLGNPLGHINQEAAALTYENAGVQEVSSGQVQEPVERGLVGGLSDTSR
jgi:hypothetical protein